MTLRGTLLRAREILANAGCDTPALDVELLAAKILGLDRTRLLMEPERLLTQSQQEKFHSLVQRRRRREPLPYILREWEFFGLTLEITPAVLILRPETETLVEICLAKLKKMPGFPPPGTLNPQPSTLNGFEVGIGSGAISIALAHNLSNLRIIATDSSQSALALARRNCLRHNLAGRITLLHGDLLHPLEENTKPHSLEFIIANLPYIPTGEIASLPPEVKDWEPRQAIDGGPDGLVIIRRLIDQAPVWLKSGGLIALEISPEQAEEVKRLLCAHNFGECELVPDLSRRPRVIIARCH